MASELEKGRTLWLTVSSRIVFYEYLLWYILLLHIISI